MDVNNTLSPQGSLPPVGAQPSAPVQQQAAIAPAVDPADPKQILAQYVAATEVVIARTQANPRVQAEEIAALKARYLKTQFGIDIQAKHEH